LTQLASFAERFLPRLWESPPFVDPNAPTPAAPIIATPSTDTPTPVPAAATTAAAAVITITTASTSTASPVARWFLSHSPSIEQEFFRIVEKNVMRNLSALGYALGRDQAVPPSSLPLLTIPSTTPTTTSSTEVECLVMYKRGRKLKANDVRALIRDIDRVFERPGIFDYQKIFERVSQ
jgi:hypothetical protein